MAYNIYQVPRGRMWRAPGIIIPEDPPEPPIPPPSPPPPPPAPPIIAGPGRNRLPGPPLPEYPPPNEGPIGGSTTQPFTPPPLIGVWKERGWVSTDGKVTLPWGQVVTLTEAMNMYYHDRQPNGDEVPPWVIGSWSDATGTSNRQYRFAPSWFGSTMQQLYNQTYTNAVRAGQNPVGIGGTAVPANYWQENGWIDWDGKVTLPTGERISLTDALNRYYPDRKPGANEIPLWARAATSPIQYINAIPAHLRGLYEQLLGQAYPAGSANRPAVSYMQGQAAFR